MLDTPTAIDSVNNMHGFRVPHKNTTAGPVVKSRPDLISSTSLHFRQSTVASYAALVRAAKKNVAVV